MITNFTVIKRGIYVLAFLLFSAALSSLKAGNEKTDSLLRVLQKVNDEERKMFLYYKLSMAYMNQDTDSALYFAGKSLQLAEHYNCDTARISAWSAISNVFFKRNDYKQSEYYNLKSLDLSTRLKRLTDIIYFGNDLGLIYWKQDKYNEAIHYFNISIEASQKKGDKVSYAKTLNNLGSMYFSLTDYPRALDYFIRALKIKEEIGQDTEIGKTLLNIGSIYLKAEDYSKSLENYRQALQIFLINGDRTYQALTYNNIGSLYERMGKADTAISYHLRSLKIKEGLNDRKGISTSYSNLGQAWFSLGDNRKALDYFMKSMAIKEEIDDKNGQMILYFQLGKVYYEMKMKESALLNFEKYIRLADEIGSGELLVEAYRKIALIYSELGDYKKAFTYDTIAQHIQDTLQVSETRKKLADIQNRYEIDKKEKENEALRKNNEISNLRIQRQRMNLAISGAAVLLLGGIALFLYYRSRNKSRMNRALSLVNCEISEQKKKLEITLTQLKQSEEKLLEANATKDKFFSMIAHDIRNPFTSIIGLADLLKDNYDLFPDNDRKEMIGNILKSSEQLYKLLEDLLHWSRAQRGVIEYKPEVFRLRVIIEENIGIIAPSANQKNITIRDMTSDTEVFGSVSMLTTVVRNLLSNAVKFTPTGGRIHISSRIEGTDAIVGVEDNGIGIPAGEVEKLFRIDQHYRTKGTAGEEGTGLGLLLCKEFVEKNGGRIWVESLEGKGSSFYFTIILSGKVPRVSIL